MSLTRSVKSQAWFKMPQLQKVFELFNVNGNEIRIVGGAVRNSLMSLPIDDIDMATTWLVKDVMACATGAGIKAIPTGIDHGTVTLVLDGVAFEITTLREDIDTDGRHAKVKFGIDWQKDALRRDFTMNGLYIDANGDVIDLVDGIDDILSANIRFIGDAEQRIKEDYLRILRFFRFFAHYGKGRPDADGLKACARAGHKLSDLSVERVWKEMLKLFSANDPVRALLWMRTTGILTLIFPETEKWGIDAISPLIETKEALGWENDPLLVLEAMIPPDIDRVSQLVKRMKMSRLEKARLMAWVTTPKIARDIADMDFDKALYRGSVSGIRDVIKLSLVNARAKARMDIGPDHNNHPIQDAASYSRLLARLDKWCRPVFPVRGKDLMAQGVEGGQAMGHRLKKLEETWIDNNFTMSKEELLGKL